MMPVRSVIVSPGTKPVPLIVSHSLPFNGGTGLGLIPEIVGALVVDDEEEAEDREEEGEVDAEEEAMAAGVWK